jgi:hypothetical protein
MPTSTGCRRKGAHLTRDDLERTIRSLRSLIDGTDPDEPNRAHAVTIAYVIAAAIERSQEED